ncbi:hypothetical protein ACPZ19_08390 [Amycolatopsis lurida]
MTNPEADQGEPGAPDESLEGLRTQIGQYGRQLARHGRRLDQHSRELERLQDDLRTLSRQIAAGLGRRVEVHGENGETVGYDENGANGRVGANGAVGARGTQEVFAERRPAGCLRSHQPPE